MQTRARLPAGSSVKLVRLVPVICIDATQSLR